jgi:uncharacterized metal-binding protein
MAKDAREKPVLIIPCSGIGKVQGLLTREAAYLVVDEMASEKTETMCLALLLKGDAEAVEAVKAQSCITIDGCPMMCAEKNVRIAGGDPVAFEVIETLKKHARAKPGNASELNAEGWTIAREIAARVADVAVKLRGHRGEYDE